MEIVEKNIDEAFKKLIAHEKICKVSLGAIGGHDVSSSATAPGIVNETPPIFVALKRREVCNNNLRFSASSHGNAHPIGGLDESDSSSAGAHGREDDNVLFFSLERVDGVDFYKFCHLLTPEI